MNKQSARIILCCVASTMLVLFLFLFVIRLTQPNCDLVYLEDVESHKKQALIKMNKTRPLKSRDKTFVIRLSAHLEYYLDNSNTPEQKNETSSASSSRLFQQQQHPTTPSPMPTPPARADSSAAAAVSIMSPASAPALGKFVPGPHPTPAVISAASTSTSFSSQQQQQHIPATPTGSNPAFGGVHHGIGSSSNNGSTSNVSSSHKPPHPSSAIDATLQPLSSAAATNQTTTHVHSQNTMTMNNSNNNNESTNQNSRDNHKNHNHAHETQSSSTGMRHYLPIEMRSSDHNVKMERLDDTRYRFKMVFSCADLTLIIVHKNGQVHLEEIFMHLRKANKKKDTCKIRLPEQAISVPTNQWRAHYFCDKLPKYSCYHYSDKAHKPRVLLADLQIHYLEYEISTNHTAIHRAQEFSTPKTYCEPPTPGGNF